MSIERFVVVSTLAMSVFAGCDSSSKAGSEEQMHSESQQIRWVSGWDTYRVNKLEAGVGNGGHSLGTYDPAHFNASKAKKDLVASDKDRGCPGRIWSTSKASGIAAMETFLTEDQPFELAIENEELEDGMTAEGLNTLMRELVNDEDNLGVFSSVFDPMGVDVDHPWACAYWKFDVYRKNGTVIRFDFDWGD